MKKIVSIQYVDADLKCFVGLPAEVISLDDGTHMIYARNTHIDSDGTEVTNCYTRTIS